MGRVIGKRIVTARGRFRCWWCWEWIEPGEMYYRWGWAEANAVESVTVHPECNASWDRASYREAGHIYECGPGEHCRGCECRSGQCECKEGVS